MLLFRMKIATLILMVTLIGAGSPSSGDAACTVCHSKNPKMVAMHEALEFKDCFTCHGPVAQAINDPLKQMNSDDRCVRCHGGPRQADPPRH